MIELKCRFCNKTCGTIEEKHKDEVADIRCDDCGITHGSYKEMEEIWEKQIKKEGQTINDFKELLKKSNYKKADFIKDNKISIN